MNKDDNSGLVLLDASLIGTGLFIVSLFISMSIIYDEKQKRLNKTRLYDDKMVPKISISNKWLVVVLSIVFLYINYISTNREKEKGGNTSNLNLQVIASILALIAAIIALYTTGESSDAGDVDVVDIENPEL